MRKFCPYCKGRCTSDHIERRLVHPLVKVLRREMEHGGWTNISMSRATGFHRDTVRRAITFKPQGFSPKIGILETLLKEVGIELRWVPIKGWTPTRHRQTLRPAGMRTKPYGRRVRRDPHHLVAALKEARIKHDLTMTDLEAETDITAAVVSDIETGITKNPHVTTLEAIGAGVGLRLVYREI